MPRRSSLLILAAATMVATGVCSGAGSISRAQPPSAWLAYGGNAQVTNDADGAVARRPAAMRRLWRTKLSGSVIASPLVASDIVVRGRRRSVVFVVTQGGFAYGLDARTGATLWSRAFPTYDTKVCGVFGTAGTPVVDPTGQRLYLVSADGLLRALDTSTGGDSRGWPPLQVVPNPRLQYAWSGLRLLGPTLYVPLASHCDERDENNRPADGALRAVDTRSRRIIATLDTVPGPQNLGGIWGWGGVSVEPSGRYIYATVGNACPRDDPTVKGNCLDEDFGLGNSIIRLTPQLKVLDRHNPPDVPDSSDTDFGATPTLFQPPGCPPLAAALNKNRHIYIWRRLALGRGEIYNGDIGHHSNSFFVGQPSYSARLRMLFVSGAAAGEDLAQHGMAGLRVLPGCRFEVAWRTAVGQPPYAPLLVLGDTVMVGTGFGKGFAVLSARSGRVLKTFKATDATFAPLSTAGGRVFGGDQAGFLYAFG